MTVVPARLVEEVDHWQRYAACATLDADGRALFFPKNPNDAPRCYALARPICRACPVRVACLLSQLNTEGLRAPRQERSGMWGGTTPQERCRIGRQLEAEPRETRPVAALRCLVDLDRSL